MNDVLCCGQAAPDEGLRAIFGQLQAKRCWVSPAARVTREAFCCEVERSGDVVKKDRRTIVLVLR